ncbi:hypothetical protein SAY87_003595 [Trapa incisa]|uniref:Uncharacterized protein n=1 Tax=Trapa incisa TaxID=236973 RepID=A0AAN7QI65_9MYRT|nr:hypothetical protein SAY87_003595 [Trapa incisa]
MHYLDLTIVATKLLSSEAWEWWRVMQCEFRGPGLNRSIRCIISGLGNHMDIGATIDMAYKCERIVVNPPPLDHVQNMEDVKEEEDEGSRIGQNH